MDFIMNTYTKDKIDDSVFQLISSCNNVCPAGTGCVDRVQKLKNNKSIIETLFGVNQSTYLRQ